VHRSGTMGPVIDSSTRLVTTLGEVTMNPVRRLPARLAAGLLVAGLAVLAGCGANAPVWNGGGSNAGAAGGRAQAKVTGPANGATDVPTSAEIAFTAAGTSTVTLTDAAGATVAGAMRPDGSSWVPAEQLKYDTKYTARITTNAKGATATASTTFTTMSKPGTTIGVHSYVGDGQVVGVAAPFVLQFDQQIPEKDRAAVQKRLWITTTPAQEGAWNWMSGNEVHFRPKDHWKTGTKVFVRAGFGGVPLSGGGYGRNDLTIEASVRPDDLEIVIDNANKQMTVTRDGTVLKTIPVSLGKPSTPSSSGSMVVMTKAESEIFDSATTGTPPGAPGYYRETIYYPLRLTWGGQYIHAAPWSVGEQGQNNVSHGCTNISTEAAKWLFDYVSVGDPVTVKNTGAPLNWGDGWTDWNVPFAEYVQGSALPYTPNTAAQAGPAAPAPALPSPSSSPQG